MDVSIILRNMSVIALKLMCGDALAQDRVIGPFSFTKHTVTARKYLNLWLYSLPQINDDNVIFQRDQNKQAFVKDVSSGRVNRSHWFYVIRT